MVRNLVPQACTIVLPNVHEEVWGGLPPCREREGILFIGGFEHPPNTDAMVWFVEEILPLVRKSIPARLTILGSSPSEEILRLSGPNVEVTGYLPDVDEHFRRSRVFVAPLRYGAGMKGKVGQAMAHGLPAVMTPVGAEGIGIVDGVHGLVRSLPQEFANAVVELMTSDPLWNRISERSLELVRQYDPDSMTRRLEGILDSLAGQRHAPTGQTAWTPDR